MHFELKLIKQFVKALNQNGFCVYYLANKLPVIIKQLFKGGIFDGSQIIQLIKNLYFTELMTELEPKNSLHIGL